MAENNKNTFQTTVESLMKGMDGFVSSKTVVGEPLQMGETIILPLVDVPLVWAPVHFVGKEEKQRWRYRWKNVSKLRTCTPERKHPSDQRKKSGWYFQAVGHDTGFC